MRRSFLAGLALTALVASVALGQQSRQSDRQGNFDQDQNTSEYRRSDSRQYQSNSNDRDTTADSSDSWLEWFSDSWSDNESGGQSQSGGQSGEDQSRTAVSQFVQENDQDNDGYLTRNELPSRLRSDFSRIDENRDNYLSQNEIRQHLQRARRGSSPVQVTYLFILDANAGNVSLNDLQKSYELLNDIDQDNDGQITRSELRQRHNRMVSRWIEDCFQNNDQNDDGQITRSEASGTGLAQRFSRLDNNSDNRLSRSELRQAMLMSSSSGSSQSASSQSDTRSRR